MWTKLRPRVSLKGPSGAIWDVDLVLRDGIMYFLNGWNKFAKAYALEENDILIFKYSGSSSFDVIIFSGRTFCEREAVYFIRKCGQMKLDAGIEKRRDVRQFTYEEEDSELVGTKRARNDVLEESEEQEDETQRISSKRPEKNRRKETVENGDCSKEPAGVADEGPCSVVGKNTKHKYPPSEVTDTPTFRVPVDSSGKADSLRAEGENRANGRNSSSILRNKPSLNGNAPGKPPLYLGYRRRGRSKKLAPSNSSVELTVHSDLNGLGEDSPSGETEEPSKIAPTSAEQSHTEHHGSILSKHPLKNLRGRTRLKRGSHKKILTKTVLPVSSIKPKPGSAFAPRMG